MRLTVIVSPGPGRDPELSANFEAGVVTVGCQGGLFWGFLCPGDFPPFNLILSSVQLRTCVAVVSLLPLLATGGHAGPAGVWHALGDPK